MALLCRSVTFIKDGNKNRLREQDIHKIVDTFTRQIDTPRYARMVPFDEIADPKNDFNLNLPRYIDSTEPEDLQDIDAHLNGGIPERDLDALSAYWQVLPGLRAALFEPLRPGYARLKLPLAEVKPAIFSHPEFTAFNQAATQRFTDWREATTPRLTAFDQDAHPKALIETVAEDLLERFRKAPLLDAYDIYQHLMDYWAETMQDDAYLIAADGWVAKPTRIIETDKKGKTRDKGWTCDLIPKPLIVSRFFGEKQAALEHLQSNLDSVSASLEELVNEHGGEEGILNDVSTKADAQAAYRQALIGLWSIDDKLACDKYEMLVIEADDKATLLRTLADHHYMTPLKSDKGSLTLKSVKARLTATDDPSEQAILFEYLQADKLRKKSFKEAEDLLMPVASRYRTRLETRPVPEDLIDLDVAARYLALLDEQTTLKAAVNEAEATLDNLAYAQYPKLSEAEIKTLVVDDKWMTHLSAVSQGELDRVSQTLTRRIRELAERYAMPLPALTDEVAALAARVEEHLKRMGAVWK
ncbi:N-6 DNA methylase [Zoogloea dura]|uniref:N-6 DNA methylase n=1 Tax=Zoogloea dura TaxID=2728840 RepID=UPI002E28D2A2|nr:N-6 DNA methylase [Zoogloea dura]